MSEIASSVSRPDAEWRKVIRSSSRLLDLRLSELWQYRDLIYLFVKRDFVATYKQTILGPLWFVIQPLMTTLIFTVIFGNIAQLSTDKTPAFLFYLCGIVSWSYFSECLNKSASTFSSNANIFSKVYFPRLTVPIANAITNLLTFAIQFTIFIAVLGYFIIKGAPIEPSYRVVVLPLLVLQMALLGIGFGCIVSSLTTRYRDLGIVMGFLVQLWMYGSCVIIPLSEVKPEWQPFFVLNPMVPVIESFRFAFLGAGTVTIPQLLTGGVVSLVVFVVGIVVFRKTERNFSDTI